MPIDDDFDASDVANELYTSLTATLTTPPVLDFSGDEFDFTPDASSPLYADVTSISIDDLTTIELDGTGTFDKLMRAVDLHIKREFKDGRITADQYAKVYVELMGTVLSNGTQFLLTKDTAHWQGIQAQMAARVAEIQATIALVELQKAKIEATKVSYEMLNSGAEYALTKMKIANANAEHYLVEAQLATALYQNENILPITYAQEQHKLNQQLPMQTQLITEQVESQRAQTLDTRLDGMTPIAGLLGKQKESVSIDIVGKQYNVDYTLPVQLSLLQEQRESERAKTLDTRTDLETVEGSIGKQKDLYDQQIDSFIKDAQHKTAKMYLDGWITQKTLDEGLLAPTQLQNANIDTVLAGIRTNNNL